MATTPGRTEAIRVAEDTQGGAPEKAVRNPRIPSVLLVVLLAVAGLVLSVGVYSAANPLHDSSKVSFSASISAATVASNQTIGVTLTDTNHVAYYNQASDYPIFPELKIGDLYATNPVCDPDYPFRLAVYQGRYTLANFSGANQVSIFDPSTYFSCPAQPLVGTPANYYSMWPYETDTDHFEVRGYWTVAWAEQPQVTLHPLPSGAYTVVAGDAWGHVIVLYFQVN